MVDPGLSMQKTGTDLCLPKVVRMSCYRMQFGFLPRAVCLSLGSFLRPSSCYAESFLHFPILLIPGWGQSHLDSYNNPSKWQSFWVTIILSICHTQIEPSWFLFVFLAPRSGPTHEQVLGCHPKIWDTSDHSWASKVAWVMTEVEQGPWLCTATGAGASLFLWNWDLRGLFLKGGPLFSVS